MIRYRSMINNTEQKLWTDGLNRATITNYNRFENKSLLLFLSLSLYIYNIKSKSKRNYIILSELQQQQQKSRFNSITNDGNSI